MVIVGRRMQRSLLELLCVAVGLFVEEGRGNRGREEWRSGERGKERTIEGGLVVTKKGKKEHAAS